MFKKSILLFALLIHFVLVFVSCEKNNESEGYKVDSQFETFVQTFVDEAQKRSYSVEPKKMNIEIKIENLKEQLIVHFYSSNPIKVAVDEDYWKGYLISQREELIFYILGRSILHRDDIAVKLPNGDPKSLMRNGSLGLWKDENYFKRQYYVDELFNPLTPVPSWAEGHTRTDNTEAGK